MGVGISAKSSRAGRKDFSLGAELAVGFQSNNGFVLSFAGAAAVIKASGSEG